MWLILSDTHDNMEVLKKVEELLSEKNIEKIFHCGDFVAPFTLGRLIKEGVDFYGVFGNNDGEVLLLDKRSGGRIKKPPISLEIDGLRIAMMHEPVLLDAIVRSQEFDLILYGHTHRVDVRKEGKTLVVNPGEACGYLSGKSTVYLFDPRTREGELLEL
ncbi:MULTISPECIES: metallophosphoesterase [unclassified Thermotoga]|uniref:metallophosphoesterase n=1 Tax=unclassified Thermotoga TaxID=2631113 RepID=UPI000280E99E|nr:MULTISPECIES: metallophosphoesterase [unclassified Thermotoga]AIY86275.1 phosphodiesterase [Thermotoga sp. 2812B]EJX26211.1 phosphodiesterase [Thermotoga sp. EMP]